MSIALGHPGGVRNSLVVFAIRFGIGLPRALVPTRRPSASVPGSRGGVWDDCAAAELAPRLAHRPIPAPSNSLLPSRFLIGVLLLWTRIVVECQAVERDVYSFLSI